MRVDVRGRAAGHVNLKEHLERALASTPALAHVDPCVTPAGGRG
jgi:hypothetical protein